VLLALFSKNLTLSPLTFISIHTTWSYVCLSHAHSIYIVLTSIWCLEMKHDCSSWLTKLSGENTHSQPGLLRHCGCLIHKQSFLLPCWLKLYSLCKLKTSMDEWTELFFQISTAKSFSFTDYEIVTKMRIPSETLLQLKRQIQCSV
jgi:hypothetical protein